MRDRHQPRGIRHRARLRPPGPDVTPASRRRHRSPVPLPARLNLTIPAATLSSLADRSGNTGSWSLTPRGRPGTRDDFGTWTLVLPGGRVLAVRIDPVPVFECDHRYETHRYQPSDRLRHLVQIRDGTCTFPPCNRHARDSDFEHAVPYDQGGRTCTCNAGARSRACHQVKQSPGWSVTQPKPGWHRWQTPAGRVYVQEPKRYPALSGPLSCGRERSQVLRLRSDGPGCDRPGPRLHARLPRMLDAVLRA